VATAAGALPIVRDDTTRYTDINLEFNAPPRIATDPVGSSKRCCNAQLSRNAPPKPGFNAADEKLLSAVGALHPPLLIFSPHHVGFRDLLLLYYRRRRDPCARFARLGQRVG